MHPQIRCNGAPKWRSNNSKKVYLQHQPAPQAKHLRHALSRFDNRNDPRRLLGGLSGRNSLNCDYLTNNSVAGAGGVYVPLGLDRVWRVYVPVVVGVTFCAVGAPVVCF